MWRLKTLASRILLAVAGHPCSSTVVIGGASGRPADQRTFDRQYEERARSVATVVAQIPQVRTAVADGDPALLIEPLANRIATGSGASYVVVTDRTGLRFSHPNLA